MDWHWLWKTALIVIVGTLLLRVAGRKSIAQMTLAQTVIMIAIGSLLIQPVSGKSLGLTFGAAGMLVVTLIVVEFSQIRWNWAERFITGHAVPVIVNGVLQERNMRKVRLTVDQLEMQLRQKNIKRAADVMYANLEPSGQLSTYLMESAQPATKADLRVLQDALLSIQQRLGVTGTIPPPDAGNVREEGTIFTEVVQGIHRTEPEERLQ